MENDGHRNLVQAAIFPTTLSIAVLVLLLAFSDGRRIAMIAATATAASTIDLVTSVGIGVHLMCD
jgi:hypothetical protein